MNEYWILDGSSSSYDLKEEIKNWCGFWVPEHKTWCIKTCKDSTAYKTLTAIGLRLQWRR